jgi:ATP sulfurylase
MIGIGGFSPLTGFMTKADWKGVCDKFLLSDGTFWPVPVTLDVSKATPMPSRSAKKSPCMIPRAKRSWPP